MYTLIIANKNYSSWSMRPWLLMTQFGIPFHEMFIPLFQPDTQARLRAQSPSGRVPCLIDGDLSVWDSLAICEYLAERHPGLWPADPADRAVARAVCAEMHSGFTALRSQYGMNIRRRSPRTVTDPALAADIARIEAIWNTCRTRSGAAGPYLFGAFSIADAYYAPVCFRFQTYGVIPQGVAGEYLSMMLRTSSLLTLTAQAAAEPESIAEYDRL
ncbi:MAG: glutathione S-transferase family protein [Proteobacteria bacterium]|nr:glutathione S-transferase family protein [Pseudomonadota bacterium]HQR03168.1 glutathione S-transferase family protein [Rhodocyclaceae bacterium]